MQTAAKLFLTFAPVGTHANDNGLALTPPMGWRSWNAFGFDVNQDLMMHVMDVMVSKNRSDKYGQPTSLCDLGYCDVGLDDAWQYCDAENAAPGFHYHDVHGNPIVNRTRFPDMKAMTDHGHRLGLTVGWYGNNCLCNDQCKLINATTEVNVCGKQITGDVKAFINFGYDSWKLDGCGGETDLRYFNDVLTAHGKKAMVENCHWGKVIPFKPDRSLPPAQGCPWNMYRTSGDLYSQYGSVMQNLVSVFPLQQQNLSYPGCWAYPDMMMVGVKDGKAHGTADVGLTPGETRTHFGGWVIVSSPLVLGLDVTNGTLIDSVWPLISNREAIAINQDYIGDSGGLFEKSTNNVTIEEKVSVSAWQILMKPLRYGRVAVLFVNSQNATQSFAVNFTSVLGLTACTTSMKAQRTHPTINVAEYGSLSCSVRDIWKQEDVVGSPFSNKFEAVVGPRDAHFYVFGGHGPVLHPVRW